jgi:hypothetical protein
MYLFEFMQKIDGQPNTFIRLFMDSGNIFEGTFNKTDPNSSSPNYSFRDKKYGDMWIVPNAIEAFQSVDNLQMLEHLYVERNG